MGKLAPFLLVLAGALLSACSLSPPTIVAITPGRGAREVATNQDIRISFDRAMDHASVERHFEMRPPLTGCSASAACRFDWTGNTMVYVHTNVSLELATTYAIVLRAGYADARGQKNTVEHTWNFVTEGRPALTGIDPGDRSTGVPPDRNLVLTFSRPMDVTAMRDSIRMSPETPFLLRTRPGADSSQFAVIPVSVLRPNTLYTVSVDGAVDTHQNRIAAKVETRFTTGPVSVARKLGYLVGQPGQSAFAIGVVDPHPDGFVGRSTPKLLFSLSDQERPTDAIVAFDWAPDGRRLVVVQATRGAPEGRLRIVDLSSGQLSSLRVSGSDAFWSPDGSVIIYLTGQRPHRLRVATQEDVSLSDDGLAQSPIAFAPDGKSIAYAAADAQGLSRLWIMNLDLRSRYRPIGLDDPADRPAWSPDGTKLAFRRLTPRGPELWVYDLSLSGSSAYRRVAPLDPRAMVWVNDNSTLIAAVGDGAGAALYKVNIFAATQAGGIVKVTGERGAPNGSSPATPLYDRRVSFVGRVKDAPQIFVMNADGTRPQQLTAWEVDFPYTGEAPNWSAVG